MNVIVGRLDRGARATGAAGATPPVAQTVWRQHGGSTRAARGQQIALFTGTALRNLCVIHRNWNL